MPTGNCHQYEIVKKLKLLYFYLTYSSLYLLKITNVDFYFRSDLKQLAKVILTRSASSVDVECMFSTMGLILNGKRSRLSTQSADALSFIHDNFFLVVEDD